MTFSTMFDQYKTLRQIHNISTTNKTSYTYEEYIADAEAFRKRNRGEKEESAAAATITSAFVDLSLKSILIIVIIHCVCFSSGMSLLQVRLVVFPSLGHQGSLPGGTPHERPFH
jgi:hypothetical protein